MTVEIRNRMVGTNGTRLHLVTAGPTPAAATALPVVLLHGFPQTWYEWRHLIPRLATRCPVFAPDLRGMGDSEPADRGQDKRTLARDVLGLMNAEGIDRAVVVGHDWGGAVAQRLALDRPDRTEALVCLNIPYFPGIPSLRESSWPARQLLHFWYVFFHMVPELPEVLAERAGERYLRWGFGRGTAEGNAPFTDADVAEYARWFTAPGRATAGFNLYRTWPEDDRAWREDRERVLELPTLWIHGKKDPFVVPDYLDRLPERLPRVRVERFETCGHWVPEERPERTAGVLEAFLDELGGSGG